MSEVLGGTGGGTPDFQSSLGEYKGHSAVATFKDAPSLAKSYIELSGKLGQSPIDRLEAPKDEAGWNKVYDKLGRPKDPKEYGIADENYSKAAHKHGLTATQAKAFYDDMMNQGKTVATQRAEARKQEIAKAETTKNETFKKEWGDKFEAESSLTAKAWQNEQFMPKDLRERLESLGLQHDPALVRLFNKLGHVSQEGGMFSAAGGGGSPQTPDALRAERGKVEAQMSEMRQKKGFDPIAPEYTALTAKRQEIMTAEGKAKLAASAA